MNSFIVEILPWIISITTLYMLWLVGNRNAGGWKVGIGLQFLWLLYIIVGEVWGLLPLNAGMWYITVRNYYKWTHSENNVSENNEVLNNGVKTRQSKGE